MNYALTGLAGSGKDTAADYLLTLLGGEKTSLAKPIKHICHTLLRVSKQTEELIEYNPKLKLVEESWDITLDDMENCAKVYYEYGLDQYEEFHDAWDFWVDALGMVEDVENSCWSFNSSLRVIYQTIGTDWGRAQDGNIWLKKFPIGNICSDVRFDNEARFLLDNNYTIIHVIRRGINKANEHASEAGISKSIPVKTVYNNGTIRDLEFALESIVKNDLA